MHVLREAQVDDGEVEGEGHQGRALGEGLLGKREERPCPKSASNQMCGQRSLAHNPCLLGGPHHLGDTRKEVPTPGAFREYHSSEAGDGMGWGGEAAVYSILRVSNFGHMQKPKVVVSGVT